MKVPTRVNEYEVCGERVEDAERKARRPRVPRVAARREQASMLLEPVEASERWIS